MQKVATWFFLGLWLGHYGVWDNLNQWIQDFLTDRQQEVVLEGVHSKAKDVTSGVPKGTVLGPPLFLVYINDMPENISSTTRLFADDAIVYRIIRSRKDQSLLQEDLDKLQDWEHNWLMQFDADKVRLSGSPTRSEPIHRTTISITLNCRGSRMHDTSEWRSALTCPGTVMLTSQLRKQLQASTSWSGTSIAVQHLWMKSASNLWQDQLWNTYASCVWDPYTRCNIYKLEMVQWRAARFEKGDFSRTSSVTAMLADLQWNTLQQRRMQCKTMMLYRIVYQLIATPTISFMIPGRSCRGHNMKFMVPQSSVNAHLHSFFPSAIRLWNQLPSFTVSAPSLENFKDHLPPNIMYMYITQMFLTYK